MTATSRPLNLIDPEDDEYTEHYLLDHIKYRPTLAFTKGKRCNFCGDHDNWSWCGVVREKNGLTVKKFGKILLCVQCLVNGGWLRDEVLSGNCS